jgi:S1-C subfamily serine protease
MAAAMIALLVFELVKTPPEQLTEKDVKSVIDKTLEEAAPEPAFSVSAYEAVRPSVVFIHTEDGTIGTGFVIVDTGIILTCLHIVRDFQTVQIIFADGSESDAEVIVRQPENDLAALQAMIVPDDLIPVTMGGSTTLQVGAEIMAVGHPFGISNSVSSGIVSGLRRQYEFGDSGIVLSGLIQFDAAVNPGNSGGPLVNRDGEVVGIVSALVNPTSQEFFVGIGFAVTIETAAGAAGDPEW